MVKELTFDKNSIILETWTEVQKNSDYHAVVGTSLYQKFFTKCPEAKVLFGWSREDDPHSDNMLKSKRFIGQATLYVKLLDTVVDMLGPDIEMLSEILEELGYKHWKTYGVSHEMYVPMGESVLETFEELLGDFFTPEIKAVWLDVWLDLSADMTKRELETIERQRQALAKTMDASSRARMAITSPVPAHGEEATRKA